MATQPPAVSGGYTPPSAGPVTPHEVYQLLLNEGFSTPQAIGIMANGVNESGLNPEAVGDQGTSFGFVQFHQPSYSGAATLVTNNPQKDIRAQIKYLASVVSPQAIAGSTASDVAGNFAANFERCVGCQSGGAQYQGRVANVAAIQTAVTSGNWTQISTSSVTGSGSSSSGSGSGSDCVLGFGGVLGVGSFCVLHKSGARALIGGLMMGAGSIVMFGGVAVLVVTAFSGTKPGRALAGTAGKVSKVAAVAKVAT